MCSEPLRKGNSDCYICDYFVIVTICNPFADRIYLLCILKEFQSWKLGKKKQ